MAQSKNIFWFKMCQEFTNIDKNGKNFNRGFLFVFFNLTTLLFVQELNYNQELDYNQ